jgi:hypothetical protein
MFNISKFTNASLVRRTSYVPVPELEPFFTKGAESGDRAEDAPSVDYRAVDKDARQMFALAVTEGALVPHLKVQALSASELAVANLARDENSLIRVLRESMKAAGSNGQKIGLTLADIARGDAQSTPAQAAYQQEIVRLGVIDDAGERLFDDEAAARINEYFALVLVRLCDVILNLTGEGSQAGE